MRMYYLLSGLYVKSEIDLQLDCLRLERSQIRQVDLSFLCAKDGQVNTPEDAELIAELAVGEDKYIYRTFKTWRGIFIRFITGDCLLLNWELDEIVCIPRLGSELEDLRDFLLSFGLTLVLQLKNIPILHGSAVALQGDALAFLGFPGYGKTTLAHYFCERGYGFLADDTVIMEGTTEEIKVKPALPLTKLCEDTVGFFGLDRKNLSSANNMATKKRFLLNDAWEIATGKACTLRALFLLQPPQEGQRQVFLEPIDSRRALLELAIHTMLYRIIEKTRMRHRIPFYGELLKKCSLYRLSIPRDFTYLPQAFQKIEEVVPRI